MNALIAWSLGAVGYFASLWLVLWFTQRVEAELDEAARIPIGVRARQDHARRRSTAAGEDIPRLEVGWAR
jgi:hypothetical protein